MHLVDGRVRTAALSYAEHFHAEALRVLGSAAADASDADDQERLACQRIGEQAIPLMALLAANELRHARIEHEQCHQRRLCGLGNMRAAVREYRNAARDPVERQQVIHAGAEDLQQLEARRVLRQTILGKPIGDDRVGGRRVLCVVLLIESPGGANARSNILVPTECLVVLVGTDDEHRHQRASVFHVHVKGTLGPFRGDHDTSVASAGSPSRKARDLGSSGPITRSSTRFAMRCTMHSSSEYRPGRYAPDAMPFWTVGLMPRSSSTICEYFS